MPEVPEENIILEPVGRDTAAAIGLAAVVISRSDPAGVLIVLPADHYIADEEHFCEVLESAVAAAAPGTHLVTLGITPNRPETGFGYIAHGRLYDIIEGNPAYTVDRFTEKPDYRQRPGVPGERQLLLEQRHLCLAGRPDPAPDRAAPARTSRRPATDRRRFWH